MSITKEQVADLRVGDVVELSFESGTIIRGPLKAMSASAQGLLIDEAGWAIRASDGAPSLHLCGIDATLTVISRAPLPVYVNHPRTEPVPGDVVRDADEGRDTRTWNFDEDNDWCERHSRVERAEMPENLYLLVDGASGQVVES